ncbi:penicillin-binding protein 2 [Candidatus Magnetomoraceae bacterium gMMP-15]
MFFQEKEVLLNSCYLKTSNEFYNQRVSLLIIFLLVSFAVLLIRLFYLQIIDGHEYQRLSENNCIRWKKITPYRGLIFDCNGVLLVDNRPSFDVGIIPKDAMPIEKVIPFLSLYLKVPEDKLRLKIKGAVGMSSFNPVFLKQDVGRDVLAAVEVNSFDLPGVLVKVTPRRDYISKHAAHLIGYLSEISKTELKYYDSELKIRNKFKNYESGDDIGKFGIEKAVEIHLRGTTGWQIHEVDVRGRVVRIMDEKESISGCNVYLTINDELQSKAEELLKGKAGAIAAMDPDTGMILAMASNPSYTQNIFVNGMSNKEWGKLISNPDRPLENKVIQGEYPPGSVYKIVTAMAGLEEGIINEYGRYHCPGYYRLGNSTFRCWKKTGHGSVNIVEALAKSCDVFFYQVGQQLGVDRLAKYAKACGLGSPTGIRLDREARGLIPTAKWKKERTGVSWQKGETLSISIGQGFDLATPIQILSLIAAVANGGVIYKPLIIKKIETAEGAPVLEAKKQKIGELPASKKTLSLIKKGLWNVINKPGGTAYHYAREVGMDISGKTGTSQVISRKSLDKIHNKDANQFKPHAWFVAFAPSKTKSKIAVVVLVEHGEHGSSGAAPLAKEMIKTYLGPKALNPKP